jgi:Transposase and inactivated derivatives, TnpA family
MVAKIANKNGRYHLIRQALFMAKSERLSILSPLEEFAFYGFPDFDKEQRATFFDFTEKELTLILKRPSFHSQVHCALQMGYFKAKKIFFRFSLDKIPQDDLEFILLRYFDNEALSSFTVTKHEYYLQRKAISDLFGYQIWSHHFLLELSNRAKLTAKRDTAPNFIAHEILDFLQNQKIVRPTYSRLQKIISQTLTQERNRLKYLLKNQLTESHKQNLKQLIEKESTLSELAALKQDAKNFGAALMGLERKKHDVLKPLYKIAQQILPHLGISQQNVDYYASLAHHYTIYDLGRFDEEQTYLYLLCYVFKRYRQINDNLVDAFAFWLRKLENEVREKAKNHLVDNGEPPDQKVGRLLLMYVDDNLSDALTLGEARQQAFEILPKDTIRSLGEKMVKKPQRRQELQWKEREKMAPRYKRHLRPLFMHIDLESSLSNNPLLKAISWMKEIFAKKQSLSQQHPEAFPCHFISSRLEPYLVTFDQEKIPIIQAKRYEIFVYRQIIKQMETGALYINDSVQHRPFADELVCLTQKSAILENLDILWLKSSCEEQINSLFNELETLWHQCNHKLKKGQLKHLKYDSLKKEVIWTKPKIINDDKENDPQDFYDKLPISEISDVLRFVNSQTGFLSAFTPLQPLYNKQKLDEEHLIAALLSQATGVGSHKMAQTSDISYHVLDTTCQQYLRLATLIKSHDCIANKIKNLSIFPHYTFDMDILYGSTDGQKYELTTPTIKARRSRKYFGKGSGVVAYTLLSNHVPIQTKLIGAHEHESHFVFDIWYGNTSTIKPTVITGDMHSVNKVNFALLHWFSGEFRPRFTNLKKEFGNIYGSKEISSYQNFLIQPAGQLNQQLIVDEKENIDRVIATLALKEMNQSTLVRKLCSLSPHNNTRKAIFEFNKLIRSIYTLKCVLDPKILSDVHRSQNRLESYHTLRAAIAKAGGRKALLGRTDLEIEISNQCGRLIAGAIIYYNALIHSCIIDDDPHNQKKLKVLKKTSPVAWQHIHFTGRFTFYTNKNLINISQIIQNIEL